MPRDTSSGGDVFNGLTHVSDHEPGIRRVGAGSAVAYFQPDGAPMREPASLERIRRLAIPPAWTNVWISPRPSGHIQAVGRDARGRKQYRYHPRWRASRDEAKYERLYAFGAALPRLRARVEADLAHRGLTRERVLGAVVRLLEVTLVRVGNTEYAKANGSFGLTTLRKRHVTLTGVGAVFEFRGKSGVIHRTGFHDRRLARVLRGCGALPGQRLFQYLDETGERHSIDSHDVNAYLRAALGADFSAKDFRTWAGTLAAAKALVRQPPPRSEAEAKRAIVTCVKAVADLLGNTPAVCRACYIHPAVFEAYQSSTLARAIATDGRQGELALLKLLSRGARG
ncbi:MAG: DNA topoisomerase IB [Caulobacteraceae bacterium]